VLRNCIIVFCLYLSFSFIIMGCREKKSEQAVAQRSEGAKQSSMGQVKSPEKAKVAEPAKKAMENEPAADKNPPQPIEPADTYEKAPMFQGTNLVDGSQISLKDYEGYVLIIDFWASWCPPCKKEIPGFIDLHKKYKDKKFAVIGISLDKGKSPVEKFVSDQKVNYPVMMGTKQIISDYEKAMGQPIRSIPTTAIINRAGGIVSVHIGFVEKEKFDEEISNLL